MARDTLILTQDIKDDQLIDSHLKAGSRVKTLTDKAILNFFYIQGIVIAAPVGFVRLDQALTGKTPAVGSGNGVELNLRHAIFQGGTNKGVLDGSNNDVNGQLSFVASLAFSINMTNGSDTGTTVGDPGDVQIGDTVTIPTPVPYTATILNKVAAGPNFTITFSALFVTGTTGTYTATRIPRWSLAFKTSADLPFNMPAQTLDFGITQRTYLSEIVETLALGLHPELIPQAGGGGGGGSGDIKSDGTVAFVANQSMGSNKLINVANGSDPADAVNLGQLVAGDLAAIASANAFSVANEKYAATFIVHPTVGKGDFQTIEAAVAAVPVSGADIYVSADTFAPPATIVLPGDRDVRIRGAGAVGITKITIPTTGGGGPSPLFRIPVGATRDYDFSGFKATGDNTFQQSLIEIDAPVNVWLNDLEVVDTRDIVVTTSTPTVVLEHCYVTFTSFATICSFWRGIAGGKMVWNYVDASFTVQSSDGIVGSPEWNVTDSYIGGGGPLATVCNLGKTVIQGMRTDKIRFILNEEDNRIVNLESIDGQVTINNTRTAIANSIFKTPTLSGNQISMTGTSGQVAIQITGCIFDSTGVSGTNFQIECSQVEGVEISGCSFSNNGTGAGTDANIGVGDTGGTTRLVVTGCQFFGGNPVQAVNEFAGLGVIQGRYVNNLGFQSSEISTEFSTVDGIRKFSGTGATVDALTALFTHVNMNGLVGSGSIKNTGANSLTIRRTATDEFGVTDFQEDVVLSGASASWNFDVALGTALPPYRSFTLSIQSTNPGSPTTYSVRAASTGAY